MQPLGAGHILGDEQLGDFVIDPANFGLLHLKAAPCLRVGNRHAFHDRDDLGAASDAEFAQLQMGVIGGFRSLVGTTEHAKLATDQRL